MTVDERNELRDLHRLFVDEYRFQTRFNWDRLQYFFVLNSAIIAVGLTLLKDAGGPGAKPYLGFIFILGFAASEYAIRAAMKGDEYYRRTIVKKTLLETLLSRFDPVPLHANLNLAIGTTEGMADAERILSDPYRLCNEGLLFRNDQVLDALAPQPFRSDQRLRVSLRRDPGAGGGRVARSDRLSYSYRNASIGSSFAARVAG